MHCYVLLLYKPTPTLNEVFFSSLLSSLLIPKKRLRQNTETPLTYIHAHCTLKFCFDSRSSAAFRYPQHHRGAGLSGLFRLTQRHETYSGWLLPAFQSNALGSGRWSWISVVGKREIAPFYPEEIIQSHIFPGGDHSKSYISRRRSFKVTHICADVVVCSSLA